jgi:hypothetical protein
MINNRHEGDWLTRDGDTRWEEGPEVATNKALGFFLDQVEMIRDRNSEGSGQTFFGPPKEALRRALGIQRGRRAARRRVRYCRHCNEDRMALEGKLLFCAPCKDVIEGVLRQVYTIKRDLLEGCVDPGMDIDGLVLKYFERQKDHRTA